MVAGINIPVTIGKVTVMPGDVVLGDREGVYFIPPQLVKKVVDEADETHIHDAVDQDEVRGGESISQPIFIPAPPTQHLSGNTRSI